MTMMKKMLDDQQLKDDLRDALSYMTLNPGPVIPLSEDDLDDDLKTFFKERDYLLTQQIKMQEFLDQKIEEERNPMKSYVFHKIDTLIEGEPGFIVKEESHLGIPVDQPNRHAEKRIQAFACSGNVAQAVLTSDCNTIIVYPLDSGYLVRHMQVQNYHCMYPNNIIYVNPRQVANYLAAHANNTEKKEAA